MDQLRQQYADDLRRLVRWANTPSFHMGIIQTDAREAVTNMVAAVLKEQLPHAQMITRYFKTGNGPVQGFVDYMEPFLDKPARAAYRQEEKVRIALLPDFVQILDHADLRIWRSFNMQRDLFASVPMVYIIILPAGNHVMRLAQKYLADFLEFVTYQVDFGVPWGKLQTHVKQIEPLTFLLPREGYVPESSPVFILQLLNALWIANEINQDDQYIAGCNPPWTLTPNVEFNDAYLCSLIGQAMQKPFPDHYTVGWLILVEFLIRRGYVKSSIQVLLVLRKQFSTNEGLYEVEKLLGDAYSASRNHLKALDALKAAYGLSNKPKNKTDILVRQQRAMQQLGQLSAAEALFQELETIVQAVPETPEYYQLLTNENAVWLMRKEMYNLAEERLRKAVEGANRNEQPDLPEVNRLVLTHNWALALCLTQNAYFGVRLMKKVCFEAAKGKVPFELYRQMNSNYSAMKAALSLEQQQAFGLIPTIV